MELSNKLLAVILLAAMIFSLSATVTTLHRIYPGISGKAASGTGTAQLTISSTVSILLKNNSIDFGSGYVNDSCTANLNNATLEAGLTFNDTNNRDCWTGATSPTAIHIENDGNNNVLLKVLGPTNGSFFKYGTTYFGSNPYALLFKARNYETNACDANGAIQNVYIDFAGANRTICSNFTFAPTRDELAIDIEIIIPRDLPAATYSNSTITFMAATS